MSRPALPSVATIGPYCVLDHLARGGMADIYRCQAKPNGSHGEVVAVKRIIPALIADPEMVSLFVDEANLALRMRHPNIVRTFAFSSADGLPYLVMEYIDGPNFGDVIERSHRRGLWLDQAGLSVLAQIALALDYVHHARDDAGASLGIVHQDATPQNILVATEGIAKLIDFGVAQSAVQYNHLQAGVLKGKASYLAPELIAGQKADARADVYALGVSMFYATTGHLPFTGHTDAETLRHVKEHQVVMPSVIRPDYPKALEKIVLGAMAPDPAQRYQSAAELHQALIACIDNARTATPAAVREWLTRLYPDGKFRTELALDRTPAPGVLAKNHARKSLAPQR
jgi:serine/threonine protein kinase